MKKIAALGAAGVLTLLMGTSVFAAGSAAGSARGTAAGGLIVHHAEHLGGHFNHVVLPDCSLSNQFCRTAAGYSVGAQVTEAPAASDVQQTASGQAYTQGSSGSYGTGSQGYGGNYTDTNSNGVCDNWESGSYGTGNQGYGGNYTDTNSNGVCDNWENGGGYGSGYGGGYGNGQGNGGGHHSGGHGRGCR